MVLEKANASSRSLIPYAPRVQVCGAIPTERKMHLQGFTGSIMANRYEEMLKEGIWPLVTDFMDSPSTLQQDGATVHRAGQGTAMLEENGVNLLDWLARSPDINPIELVWGTLKKTV